MHAARHKGFMRKVLDEFKDLAPKSRLVTSLETFRQAALEIGYPFIVKPAGGTLSIGVFKVQHEADLESTFSELQKIAKPSANSLFLSSENEFVVEEFMEGPEFSVEGVSSYGTAHFAGVTEKWKRSSDFLETKHLFPARITNQVKSEIIECANRALQAIDWQFGGFHIEIILTQKGPRIVEINGRLGGDYISTHLVPLASGINIWRENLNAFLGNEVQFVQRSLGHACVSFKVAESSGIFYSIEGIESLSDRKRVKAFFPEIAFGSSVSHHRSSTGELRLAALITLGESSEEALIEAEKSLEKIEFNLVSQS
jgi:biotin carboxylase